MAKSHRTSSDKELISWDADYAKMIDKDNGGVENIFFMFYPCFLCPGYIPTL